MILRPFPTRVMDPATSSLSELFWGPVVEQLTWVIALSRKTSLVYIPGWKKIQEQQPAGVDRCVGAFFLGYIRGLFFRNSHTGLVPREHVCVVHLSAQPLAPRANASVLLCAAEQRPHASRITCPRRRRALPVAAVTRWAHRAMCLRVPIEALLRPSNLCARPTGRPQLRLQGHA